MRHSVFVRCIGLGAAAALGGVAHAGNDNFFGRTMGTFTFTDPDPPVFTGTFDQFFFIFEGPVTFDTLAMTFRIEQEGMDPGTMSGEFTFIGTNPADTLSGTYAGVNIVNPGGIWTSAGTWTTSGGTGAFAGLSGEGAYTSALFVDGDSAATAFDGTIIPGPASAALLGLGTLAVARRRRSHA